MRSIEAVIFDYGGVISTTPFPGMAELEAELRLPPKSLARLLFGETRRRAGETAGQAEEFLAVYDETVDDPSATPPDWHLLETGQLTLGEFHQRLTTRTEQAFGQALDFAFFERFLQTLSLGVHWAVIHRIRELRHDGYLLAILTNNVREWKDEWRASIPMELFDVVIDSSEVGLRKPDPAIFQLTCERLGVAPEAAVFLDDSPRHVRAAQSVGLTGILFGDPVEGLAALDETLKRSAAA